MTAAQDFVGRLHQAAVAAQQAELAFRRDVARIIAEHERERQFAFRRVDIARTMEKAARGAATLEQALAAQEAALRREFGWHGDNEQRRRILDAWRAVATAVAASLGIVETGEDAAAAAPAPLPALRATAPEAVDPDAVADAMRRFEAWYEQEVGTPFLALLDHEIPEMPVVEF